ncbi:hypothetical protein LMG19089_02891 [Ralstonia edaphis]|uniref:DUF2591 domain-containing protein n=1 Tax=Ralstonia edaphi TaxID=3058599 RepID=UPI0028F5997E|nr:DUF2591 domain-containing protein [Ralstonia sp. LMG 6871]CAJ0701649.1 hypothetical protein LMG19089_02891 [Ralstonia sp. LMG 6871]
MKVAELEGALLDYWVARAEGYQLEMHPDCVGTWVTPGKLLSGRREDAPECVITEDGNPDHWSGPFNPSGLFHPSRDWAQGGPIIEHARIQIVPQNVNHLRWSAYVDEGLGLGAVPVEQYGENPLVAAMRAYVASRFGDDVPDTLESGPSGSV